MKIYNSLDELIEVPNAVLTIGTFDGVHLGHQKILEQLNQEAEMIEGESVLLTFSPHPRKVLFPEKELKLIQTQIEKERKLERFSLDNLVVIPFTRSFSNLSAAEFVENILVEKCKIKKLVIGYDHQFGKDREGNIDFLKAFGEKYGFTVIEISAEEINEVNVSSTRIRRALEIGDVETANLYLNEPFELSGLVVRGEQLGRKIGFSTANIKPQTSEKLIPANGVYFVSVEVKEQTFYGMMNIGVRPTIDNKKIQSIEVHIFDFLEDIYGCELHLKFISKVREEQKFESLEKLIDQLKKDERYCRNFISDSL